MSDEITVKVEGVSKKYCKDLKRSLRYGLQDLADELMLKKRPSPQLRKKEFWALQDVNFELKRGEAFGIIGVNGSGKTTLLKLLYGILKPTTGRITIKGQMGALITLGAGFQPLLTGRENIYTNAAILGIPKRDVNEKLDEILEFAGIGDFIDAPVKTYSSGMKGRLGFSVAVNLVEPDVLLLDEVLATGDWRFKERCFRRMEEIVNSGATIVFISHLVPKVEQLCHRALLLHKGVVQAVGPTAEVCEKFYELPEIEMTPRLRRRKKSLKRRKAKNDPTHDDSSYDYDDDNSAESFELLGVEVLNTLDLPQTEFKTLEPLVIRVRFKAYHHFQTLKANVQILTVGDQICISSFNSSFEPPEGHTNWFGEGYIDCIIPELLLRQGRYKIHVALMDVSDTGEETLLFTSDSAGSLFVGHDPNETPASKKTRGIVYMASSWRSGTASKSEMTTR
jgi:ABC-type polysaccharide/polyol phosphate transport system ATPase subunit